MTPFKPDPIREAIDELFSEYRNAEEQIHEWEQRIVDRRASMAKLQSKIVALARVCDEAIDIESDLGQFLVETAATGITDGVRAVLQASGKWMAPTEIRNDLLRLGYDLDGYTNIMASLHTVLTRLRGSGEVRKGVKKPRRTPVYRWAAFPAEIDKNIEVLKEPAPIMDVLRRSVVRVKKD